MEASGVSIWVIVILVLFSILPLSCAWTAQKAPAEQGGVAGWLLWYAVCYSCYAAYFLIASINGGLAFSISALLTFPLALAAWVTEPIGRLTNMYGNYGLVILCLPLAVAGAHVAWVLIGTSLAWGTYFLRSERVKITYAAAA